jgi:uncharacterized membrane protein
MRSVPAGVSVLYTCLFFELLLLSAAVLVFYLASLLKHEVLQLDLARSTVDGGGALCCGTPLQGSCSHPVAARRQLE